MGFKQLPLARKLIAAMLLTAGVALLLAAAVFAAYEVYDYRANAVQQVRALGGITAANSVGAMAFVDPVDAQRTLSALRAERQVTAAALYDSAGRLFATYPASIDRAILPHSPGAPGFQFVGQRLEYFTPVSHEGSALGVLFLRLDTSELSENLMLFGLITAAVLAIASLIALLLARRLQHLISAPILALSDTARAVAEQHDYSVRAAPVDQREIQVLNDAFNLMLKRIDETQTHLESQLVRLDLLQRTTRAISERLDLPSVLQVIVGRLESELPVELACIAKYVPDKGLCIVQSVGTRAATLSHRVGMRLHEQIAVAHNQLDACIDGKVLYEPNLKDLDWPLARRFAREGLSALVVAPLATGDVVWGILIAARTRPDSFSSTDVEFLRQLSDHASLAVRQAQLTDDLKNAYEELRQSQLTIAQQERLRALGQMASGIAHDINNAVSPIALYVETLLEREPMLSSRGRGQLETIRRAIGDVTQTVQRMREFYRRRDVPADAGAVEMNELCRAVTELTRARWADDAQERGVQIELRTEFSPEPVWVRGIDSEIRDALVNLVFNAVDAMPQGGVLTIHTGHPKQEGVGLACVAVTDTGIGMDEKTRARCLEPFFTTKGERGTGMGLAMVYGMLQRHGGQIDIESDLGRGTTVRLHLPSSTPDASAPRLPVPKAPVRRLRLLVVDDDPLLLQSMRDALELDGHLVTIADGGQSGIDAFMTAQGKNERPDAVITDLGMPHLDGRAVAAAIKAVDPRTTVILLTGWGARLMAESDVPSGVDRVLSKPPRLAQLREVLATVGQPAEAAT